MKTIAPLLLLLLSTFLGFGQERMTPERFRDIVASPVDNVTLQPKLAAVTPPWTNATVTIVLKYQSGKTFKEEGAQTSKTIAGKYVVFTGQSQLYHRRISSILTFDEKASAFKLYSLLADSHGSNFVAEATILYDQDKKIYAASSEYGNGFMEITLGSYSDDASSDRTLVYKDGVLFLTREVTARSAVGIK